MVREDMGYGEGNKQPFYRLYSVRLLRPEVSGLAMTKRSNKTTKILHVSAEPTTKIHSRHCE